MKRQNGAGTLIKTKTGLFIGKWTYEGKVYTKSLQTYDRKEAEKKLDELVRPFLDKNHIAVLQNIETRIETYQSNIQIEIDKLFEVYFQNVKGTVSDGTLRLRKIVFNNFAKWCKDNIPSKKYLQQLTQTDFKMFLDWLSEGHGVETYNNNFTALRLMFDIVIGKHNQLHRFTRKKLKRIEDKRVLNRAEIQTILEVCKKTHEKILFYLVAYTGMRLSDASTLKWINVDLEGNVIKKYAVKTGKLFIVPIHPELKKILVELGDSNSEYVSPKLNLMYFNGGSDRVVSTVLKRSGLQLPAHTGVHIFRHSFCTHAANNGISMPVLMRMLGHTNPSTTLRYYHNFNADSVREQLMKIF